MSTKTVILCIVLFTILTKFAQGQTYGPNENVIINVVSSFTVVSFKSKLLKRRLLYSTNHPGSYNPTVISNQEAHMIYGNMDGKKQQNRGGFRPVSPVSVHRSGSQTKERMTLFTNIFRKIKKRHPFLRSSSQYKANSEMSLKV